MERQEYITDGYGRVLQILEEALDGLTQDDLNKQPRSDCNSIGWLVWHVTRVQDYGIAELMGEKQLWIRDRWHAKFNRAPNPSDIGFEPFGHSAEDVVAFKAPNVETLLEYYRAVLEWSERYISSLSATDLDRELNKPAWTAEKKRPVTGAGVGRQYQPPTVGVRLISILSECLQHAGQVAYLRGLLKGRGWLQE